MKRKKIYTYSVYVLKKKPKHHYMIVCAVNKKKYYKIKEDHRKWTSKYFQMKYA